MRYLNMKKSLFPILSLVILALTVSCFEDIKVETSPYAAITSFKLGYYYVSKNDVNYLRRDTIIQVRENGSMYPMTIDQINNRIYNRDSLAQGSILNSVTCTIGSYGTVFYRYDDVEDSLVMKWSSDAAIDFTRPLKFYAISTDETYLREYSFNLNVHKVNPDSMSWRNFYNNGVTGFSQKMAVCRDDILYDYCVGPGNVPYVTWTNVRDVSWSEPAELSGIEADGWNGSVILFGNTFYTVCGTDLFKSVDGITWSPAGASLSMLFSTGNGSGVIWAVDTEGMLVSSTDMVTWVKEQVVPSGFPDRSVTLFCDTLATNPGILRYVIAGLVNEGGSVRSSVWTRLSVDDTWTRQTDALKGSLELPVLENLSMISYDGSLFAFGTPVSVFWQSLDHGLTWNECDRYSDYYTTFNNFMQFPEGLKGTGTKVACATDGFGGIWFITDEGKVWRGAINRLNRL